MKPGFAETEGFPQSWLPGPVQRIVLDPEDVARHVLDSLERGRGETSVPRWYGPAGGLQALVPNLFARVLARGPHPRRIA